MCASEVVMPPTVSVDRLLRATGANRVCTSGDEVSFGDNA